MAYPDDAVQGCVAYLLQQTPLTLLLGSEKGIIFLFQDKLEVPVEKTSSAAIVISGAGGWAPPNSYNTMMFPRLRVDIYADPPRDAVGRVTRATEARTLVQRVGNVLDTYLHQTSNEPTFWREVVAVSSTRLAELTISQLVSGDRTAVGSTYYGAQVLYQP